MTHQVTANTNLMLTEEEEALRNVRGNVSHIVSRSVRGKTLMYECKRSGRKDKDNSWEPLNFLQVTTSKPLPNPTKPLLNPNKPLLNPTKPLLNPTKPLLNPTKP